MTRDGLPNVPVSGRDPQPTRATDVKAATWPARATVMTAGNGVAGAEAGHVDRNAVEGGIPPAISYRI